MEKDARISQIIQQITAIPEVNIDSVSESKHTQLVLYAQSKGIVRGIFNQDNRLTQYHVASNDIEAIEILTK